uniref:Hemicentin-1 n=1 Tax=Magallana gigas TaxID=29159 RepID=K1PWH9_MAGGI
MSLLDSRCTDHKPDTLSTRLCSELHITVDKIVLIKRMSFRSEKRGRSVMIHWIVGVASVCMLVLDDDGDGVADEDCAKPYPIDGVWTAWERWGPCACAGGGGSRTRRRMCDNPAPQYDGKNCAGSDVETDTTCSPSAGCRLNGNWALWGSWTSCSVTCGSGTQSRTRTCTDPAPANGGSTCSGNSTASQACNTQNCPKDGNWNSWSIWSPCTKSCGSGVRARNRDCNNPVPSNGGKGCAGDPSDFQTCNPTACPTVAPGTYVQTCPTGWFSCQSGAMTCIAMIMKCDCQDDCDDGSDESVTWASCLANTTSCNHAPGKNIIRKAFLL